MSIPPSRLRAVIAALAVLAPALFVFAAPARAQPDVGVTAASYDAEIRAAADEALTLVRWAAAEHAEMRGRFAERMRGRAMVNGRGGTTAIEWRDDETDRSTRESTDALLQRMQTKLRWLPADWRTESYFQDFTDPTTDWLGFHPGRGEDPYALHGEAPPGPAIDPADLTERVAVVREELDEIVVQCLEDLWTARLRLTGFSHQHWGEANAVAAEIQARLDVLAAEFSREAEGHSREELEALLRGFEARERALLDEPAWRAKFDAILADADALRTRCAARALRWAAFAEENFQAGPQGLRQEQLDRLSRRLEGFLDGGLTRLRPHWLRADRPALYTDPIMVMPRAEDAPVRGEPVAVFVRPEFAAGLADRAEALLASPTAPAGHKRLVATAPPRSPRVYAAIVARDTLTEDPVDRLLDPDAPPFVPDSPGVTLCVFGLDLLAPDGRFVLPDGGEGRVVATTPGAAYERIGSLPAAIARRRLPADHTLLPLLEEAVACVTRDLLPEDAAAFELMQVLVLNARLARGLPPGIQNFEIAGAEGMWVLPNATTDGRLELVRPRPSRVAAEADRPDEFFVFDRFTVQLETRDPLTIDEVPIVVLRNGEPLRLRAAPGQTFGTLTARAVPGDPRLLRTDTVFLASPGSAAPSAAGLLVADAAPGDLLQATLGVAMFSAPLLDQALVLLTPDQIRSGEGKGMLFSEAVADAARLNGIDAADLNLADDRVVETITNTIVFNWQRHHTRVTLGDHAAMLLLKRTFLGMAGDRLRSLEALSGDPGLVRAHVPEMERQFREWERLRLQSIDAHGLGSGRIFVPPILRKSVHIDSAEGLTPFGRQQFEERRASNQPGYFPLSWAFWSPGVEVFATAEARDSFRLQATREALRLQIEETRAAIEHARNTDDGNVEELLQLTGRGFDPVVARVLPRLVFLRADASARTMEWLPHEAGRTAVLTLSSTLAELDTAAEGAREDTEALLAVLSAFGVGVGANVVGKAVLAAASTVSIGVAAGDVLQLQADRAEARFALNAAAVIGRDRFEFDLREKETGMMPYVSLGLAVVGFRLDLADLVSTVRLSQARRVAERWMPDVSRGGFDALAEIPLEEKSLVYLLIEEAERARAAGRPLTPAQEAAIKAGEMLERQVAARPGHWVYDDWRLDAPTVNPRYEEVTRVDPGQRPIPLPNTERAIVRARQPMPRARIPEGMPEPGYRLDLPGRGGSFLVGEPIGRGAFATAYELLDERGLPTGKVVKFMRHHWEQGESQFLDMFGVGGRADGDFKLIQTHAPWDPTPLEEIVERMHHGQTLLAEAGIPHLRMDGFDTPLGRLGDDADLPFVVQEGIPTDGTCALFGESMLPNDPAVLTAVAKLYRQIADAGLIWKDGHVGNIFFRRVADAPDGGQWVAGVLDPDMIIRWEDAADSVFLRREIAKPFSGVPRYGVNSARVDLDLAYTDEWASDLHRRVASGPHEFMAKMLEHKGWIRYRRFDAEQVALGGPPGVFEDAIMPIELVRGEFGDLERWVTFVPD